MLSLTTCARVCLTASARPGAVRYVHVPSGADRHSRREQHLSQAEAARTYGVSEATVSRLVTRYRRDGPAAFQPQSRAPHTHPGATSQSLVDTVWPNGTASPPQAWTPAPTPSPGTYARGGEPLGSARRSRLMEAQSATSRKCGPGKSSTRTTWSRMSGTAPGMVTSTTAASALRRFARQASKSKSSSR